MSKCGCPQTRPGEILFYLARDVPISDDVASQTSSTASLIAATAIRQPGIIQMQRPISQFTPVCSPTDRWQRRHPGCERKRTNEGSRYGGDHQPDAMFVEKTSTDLAFILRSELPKRGSTGVEALQWDMGLDFNQIATLDYLSCDFISNASRESHESNCQKKTCPFRALNWADSTEMSAFTRLVEQTEHAGLPHLANFRTTAETLVVGRLPHPSPPTSGTKSDRM